MPYWNSVPQKLSRGGKDLSLQLEEEGISSESTGLMEKGKSWHVAQRKQHLFSKVTEFKPSKYQLSGDLPREIPPPPCPASSEAWARVPQAWSRPLWPHGGP